MTDMIAKTLYSKNESLHFALVEIKEKLDDLLPNFDFLIFSFHPKYDYHDINYFVNKVFSTDKWVGFHAVDSFVNDEIIEGVSVLALKYEKDASINVFFVEDISYKDSLEKTANYLNSNQDKLHIVIAGICEEQFDFFVENLRDLLTYRPVRNIVGGLSSGYKNNNEELTFQFLDRKVIKNGFVILTFDKVDFEIGISLGFKPYGITYEIKKAEGYKIFLVDEGKNFSYIVQNILKGIDNPVVEYLWYIPINILDDEDGYVATLRTIKDIHKNFVEFFGPVKVGQKFKFSFGEKNDVLNEDLKTALKVKESIRYPDFILNFSCIARQYVLEDKQREENKIYINTLNAPLFGFFTFGEIGPDKFFKKLKFYNETSLIVGIKEK
ncbi:MAG: hypothetical protein C0198_06040 [Sulfurihydrogenibium sp.]|nr:MAG: hypothetical protein C0198_06040 [Sulfurihydrogenibium sp.]